MGTRRASRLRPAARSTRIGVGATALPQLLPHATARGEQLLDELGRGGHPSQPGEQPVELLADVGQSRVGAPFLPGFPMICAMRPAVSPDSSAICASVGQAHVRQPPAASGSPSARRVRSPGRDASRPTRVGDEAWHELIEARRDAALTRRGRCRCAAGYRHGEGTTPLARPAHELGAGQLGQPPGPPQLSRRDVEELSDRVRAEPLRHRYRPQGQPGSIEGRLRGGHRRGLVTLLQQIVDLGVGGDRRPRLVERAEDPAPRLTHRTRSGETPISVALERRANWVDRAAAGSRTPGGCARPCGARRE